MAKLKIIEGVKLILVNSILRAKSNNLVFGVDRWLSPLFEAIVQIVKKRDIVCLQVFEKKKREGGKHRGLNRNCSAIDVIFPYDLQVSEFSGLWAHTIKSDKVSLFERENIA